MGKLNKKWSYEDVKKYIESFNYKLISKEYINSREKILVQCDKGHIYETTFNSFKNKKSRCPICNGGIRYNYEYVKEYIESFGYKLLSKEYTNARSKLKVQCDKGHIYEVTFDNFKHGYRCPYCAGNIKYNYEYIKKYIESFGYELISKEYIGVFDKLIVKCPKGHIYEVNFNNFKNGYRCPICNQSSGEQEISRILGMFKVNFKCEYKFKDCKDKNMLPFDFYLSQYNCCIEFDGKQHFEVVNFNNDEYSVALNNFEIIKKHDNIKTQYCKDNNIKLIRIPYWDYKNIEKILIKELNLK